MDNIFMEKKKSGKKEKNCGRPTGFDFSHPLDRKQNFFYGQPNIARFTPLTLCLPLC